MADGVAYAVTIGPGCTALDGRLDGFATLADLVRDDAATDRAKRLSFSPAKDKRLRQRAVTLSSTPTCTRASSPLD